MVQISRRVAGRPAVSVCARSTVVLVAGTLAMAGCTGRGNLRSLQSEVGPVVWVSPTLVAWQEYGRDLPVPSLVLEDVARRHTVDWIPLCTRSQASERGRFEAAAYSAREEALYLLDGEEPAVIRLQGRRLEVAVMPLRPVDPTTASLHAACGSGAAFLVTEGGAHDLSAGTTARDALCVTCVSPGQKRVPSWLAGEPSELPLPAMPRSAAVWDAEGATLVLVLVHTVRPRDEASLRLYELSPSGGSRRLPTPPSLVDPKSVVNLDFIDRDTVLVLESKRAVRWHWKSGAAETSAPFHETIDIGTASPDGAWVAYWPATSPPVSRPVRAAAQTRRPSLQRIVWGTGGS